MKLFIFNLLLGLFNLTYCCVLLKLGNGIIKGRLSRITNTNKVFYSFQEIPYAAPPIGDLRFQLPQLKPKWNQILNTFQNTKICHQIGSNSSMQNEDCLYLNVYSPKLPSNYDFEYLPVMVYIHGGGFVAGDALYASFGPEFLVNYDVVVVTFNYRLGVFGFLSTQDDVISGNNGLKDQLLVLQWVKENIYRFGGDSSKITIFGQSAGASSVGYHLVSAKSKGLFRAAIMESASALNPFGLQRYPKKYALKIASSLNSSLTDKSTSKEILYTMRSASAQDIDQVSKEIADQESYYNAQLFQGYYYAPVLELESEEAFITEKMYEVISRGDASSVPIVIGINSEESLSQTTDLTFLKRIMSAYDNDLKALVPWSMNINNDTIKYEVGALIRKLYSGDDLLQNISSAGIRYMSDMAFTRSVIKHAELQSQYSDVYFYKFSYDGSMGNISIIVDGAERVGHNEENAYLWRIHNDMFYNYNLSIFPDEDIITQKRLLTLWTNFAKTLNPTPEKIDLFENIIWPKVNTENNNFFYLDIDKNFKIKNYPKEESYKGWTAIYEKYGVHPFDTY